MTGGLTIGQAAAFAGITIKTVRHYHRLGLLDEPGRDTSGYRRYGASDLLRLVQVRTLAGAGVPLARVGDLLEADPQGLADALDDVERRLTDRIDELVARRAALHRLGGGDRLLLPERACAALERLTAAGFSEEYVEGQRDSLVLGRALLPEIFERHLAQIERQLADPGYGELMKRCWDARSWAADDPRLDDLARALADRLLAAPDLLSTPDDFRTRSDGATRYGLLNHFDGDRESTAARLTVLVERRLRAAGVEVPEQ